HRRSAAPHRRGARSVMILAGDVGGTKTALALFDAQPSGLHQVRDAVLHNAHYAAFDDVIADFLRAEVGTLEAACFGVAGPIINRRAKITNLPWVLDEAGLMRLTKAAKVKLINDLAATAYGV